MSKRAARIKELAESEMEKLLAWQMGLPAPFTAVSELVKLVTVAVLVWWLA